MALYMVGDSDQLLFRFTGARPELMTDEIEGMLPEIETNFLSTNYRSTQEIINACGRLISFNYSDKGGPYRQELFKNTQAREDAPAGDLPTYQLYATVQEEAEAVVAIIQEQLESGYEHGDIFVGARTRAQLGYLEGPLFRAGIKYVSVNGSFWDNYHVANVLAYLKLAINQRDTEAFGKVFNIASADHTNYQGEYCHHRWMGAEFLNLTGSNFNNMDAAIRRNKRYRTGVEDLRRFVSGVQSVIGRSTTASDAIHYVMENCYMSWMRAQGYLLDDDVDSSAVDDLETVKEVAASFDSVESFLAHVDEMVEAAKKAKEGNADEFVVLSTIHQLKGKERKIVVGIGWAEGEDNYGNPRGLLPHTFSLTDPPQMGVLPGGSKGKVSDERCMAFVLASRAQEKLFLTGCATYRNWIMGPSRFVQELGPVVLNEAEPVEADEESLDGPIVTPEAFWGADEEDDGVLF